MSAEWQTYVALLFVAASITFLAWRITRLVWRRGCGGGCTGCSAKDSMQPSADRPKVFVTMESRKPPLAPRK